LKYSCRCETDVGGDWEERAKEGHSCCISW
jgi:hypothetical protein